MTERNPMRTFAAYIMRGRLAAMLIAATFALLSLLVPPLMQLSAAVVALVTLRHSAPAGLVVMLGAGMIAALFAGVALSDMSHGFAVVIAAWAVSWLPVWLAANALRVTRSLALALMVAAGLGIGAVVFMNIVLGDTAAWWRDMLTTAFAPVLGGDAVSIGGDDLDAFLDALAGLMTGIVGAGIVIGAMTGLFIGRWWQAMLYNPGGFRAEFHALRVGRQFALFAVVVATVMMFGPAAAARLASDVLIVIIAAYMFAGLALAHAFSAAKQASAGWLIAMYGALFVLPQLVVILAAAGFTDSWMDLRGHFKPGRTPGTK